MDGLIGALAHCGLPCQRADWDMIANQLLQRLPPEELTRLLPMGEQLMVPTGFLALPRHKSTPALLFPLSGVLCLVARVETHAPLQLAMVGREGLIDAGWLQGAASPAMGVRVQQAGEAWYLPATAGRLAARASPSLDGLQARYQLQQRQALAIAAACLHFHTLQQRLARWLLMTQDRIQGDGFHVTQGELAHLLGVRRAGVSVAIGRLQSAGLLHHQRAWLRVENRAGLRQLTCSCYELEFTTMLSSRSSVPVS